MKERRLKGVIILAVAALVVIAIFFRFSNNSSKSTSEEDAPIELTAVQTVLLRNLATNYPQTPKEVIKYFAEITQCYYNETFESDEEFESLASQMLLLYDDELVSYKTYTDYILDLKSDIAFYNQNGYKISSYAPSASTDVEYFSEDGYEWARLRCVFTLKSGKYYKPVTECFILRKDEKSHWRIYGWQQENE